MADKRIFSNPQQTPNPAVKDADPAFKADSKAYTLYRQKLYIVAETIKIELQVK
ncbi:MAG: hypothetical protein KAS64_07475 [Spirochaetes bacterium]|nr:hypothetical protein [Spirochaetota bacterium]